ncbi:MAG: hypothetical protein NTW13_04830 [Candidatus Omnitrophica bacterium]|nr:hypothetical protein [Candidatus Omnitrophota bacterium]
MNKFLYKHVYRGVVEKDGKKYKKFKKVPHHPFLKKYKAILLVCLITFILCLSIVFWIINTPPIDNSQPQIVSEESSG